MIINVMLLTSYYTLHNYIPLQNSVYLSAQESNKIKVSCLPCLFYKSVYYQHVGFIC